MPLGRIFRRYGPAVAALALCATPLAAASAAEGSAEHAKTGNIELIIDGDGSSVAMAQELAGVVDDGATRRLLPVVGHGGVRDLIDLNALRSIDVAIVSMDALDFAKKPNSQVSLENVTYIARLYDEELHVLARPHIHSIEDLAGRRVNFDGSAVVTGPQVLSLLKIDMEAVFDPPAVAQSKLRSGDIAAIVYLAPKPTPRFAMVDEANGLHFLPIPMTPELAKSYSKAMLSAKDYPRLVQDGTPIETVGVGMVMIAGNLPKNGERYRNVAKLVDAFFTQLPQLQAGAHGATWAEVDLAAALPGWPRFPPAEAWLKLHKVAPAQVAKEDDLQAAFAKFLDDRSRHSGGPELSAEEKGKLFEQFRRWKSAQTTQ